MALFTSDINEMSVLQAFVEHTTLSWPDFGIKNIFRNIQGGSNRASLLSETVRALEDKKYIDRLQTTPPSWIITSEGKGALISEEGRQRKEKRKEELDFLGKQFIYKARYWPHLISVAALTVSIITATQKCNESQSKPIQQEQRMKPKETTPKIALPQTLPSQKGDIK